MKMFLSVLVAGLMVVSSAFAADETSSRLIQKYLDLAEELSVARANQQVCDVNAYPNEILSLLENASYLDGFQPSQIGPVTRQELKDSLRFKEVAGEFKPWEVKTAEQWSKVLARTSFNSPPMGVFGSLKNIEFLPNGRLKQTELVSEDAMDFVTVISHGTWAVHVKETRTSRLVRVALTLPGKDGKSKTTVFRLSRSEHDYKTWILHVKPNGDEKTGDIENVRFYNEIVGECEA